jgi:hypothetical protein
MMMIDIMNRYEWYAYAYAIRSMKYTVWCGGAPNECDAKLVMNDSIKRIDQVLLS